jgi:cation diffusion facilitator CzcD-associated flavoprotein CzcO
MAESDYASKYCIVGAGSSGITAAKNLKELGIPFDIFEREDDVGGVWYYGKPQSSIYKSVHTISSKLMTRYVDYPMPDDYPDYPNHEQICAYLRSYARHFDLYPLIQFNTAVEKIEPADGRWDVTLSTRETRRYKGVIIANGHLWDAKLPDYPGKFDGLTLHSKDYKSPDVLRGKRVLVVGAGNSGCDIAVEAALNASRAFHSVRRGYYYVPKLLFGRPTDQVNEVSMKLGVPLWARRIVNGVMLKIVVGSYADYHLPKPDHKLLEAHPLVNSQILYFLRHGDITPKPDVEELCGDSVKFKDGSIEPIDVIVYATGFNITFPFIDKQYLNWKDGRPSLYMHVFHPEYDNLFVAGLIQPDSGQFGLADWQCRVIARFIRAQEQQPEKAAWFREIKAKEHPNLSGGAHYVNSTRHYLEIEHYSYRERLKRLAKKFGA